MGEEQAIAPLPEAARQNDLPLVLFLRSDVFPLYQKCTGWDRWDCRKMWRRREDAPRWSKQKKPWCNTCGHAEGIPFGEWLPEQYGPTWFVMLSRAEGHFVTNIDPPIHVHPFRPVPVPGPVNPPPQDPGPDVLQAFWQGKYGIFKMPPREPSKESCLAQHVPTYDTALASRIPYDTRTGNMLLGSMDNMRRPVESPSGTAAWTVPQTYQTTYVSAACPAALASTQSSGSNQPIGNVPVCLPQNMPGVFRQYDYTQPIPTQPQHLMTSHVAMGAPPHPVNPAYHEPLARTAQPMPPVQSAQSAQLAPPVHLGHAVPHAQGAQSAPPRQVEQPVPPAHSARSNDAPQFVDHSKMHQTGSYSNSTVESADLELKQVRAVEAFDAVSYGEEDGSLLSLALGDVIEIDGDEPRHDGWVYGRNIETDQVGWFPEGYTDPL